MTPDYSKPITRDDANTVINNRIELTKDLHDLIGGKKEFSKVDKDRIFQFFTSPLNSFIFSRRRLDELFSQKTDSEDILDCIVAIYGAELDPESQTSIPTIILSACHSSKRKSTGKSDSKVSKIHLVTPNTEFPATETPPKQTLAKLPDPS